MESVNTGQSPSAITEPSPRTIFTLPSPANASVPPSATGAEPFATSGSESVVPPPSVTAPAVSVTFAAPNLSVAVSVSVTGGWESLTADSFSSNTPEPEIVIAGVDFALRRPFTMIRPGSSFSLSVQKVALRCITSSLPAVRPVPRSSLNDVCHGRKVTRLLALSAPALYIEARPDEPNVSPSSPK